MRHEDDLRSQQRGRTHVFDDVVVVTDQDAASPSVQIEHGISIARQQIWIDKGMQLAMLRDYSGAVYADLRLVQASLFIFFEQPGEDRDIEFPGDPDERLYALALRDGLGEGTQLLAGKPPRKRVAGYRTLVKGHHLCAGCRGLRGDSSTG